MSVLAQNPVKLLKKHRKAIGIAIIFLFSAIIVIAIQRAMAYDDLEKKYNELEATYASAEKKLEEFESVQEQLTYSEQQVVLLKESTNALKEQVSGLNAEKEDLNNKLEDLLRVRDTVPEISRETLEAQINSLSELVTKKYMYRNATKQEEGKDWLFGATMPFSDTKFVAMYDGVVTAGIDLSEVSISVNQSKKQITVTLPPSKIFDHNIPQETINVLEVKNNLFNSVSFNDYNRFISAEKDVMEETAIGQGILNEANQEAKEIIKAFLEKVPGMDTYTLKFN